MKKTLCASMCLALVGAWWYVRFHAATPDSAADVPHVTPVAGGYEVLSPNGADPNEYVGFQACAPCHDSICKAQNASHMANSLKTVADYQQEKGALPPAKFYDEQNDIRYEVVASGDQLYLSAAWRGQSAQVPFTYVLGSGLQGLSFLHERGPQDFQELRLSFYTKAREWDFTGAQEDIRPESMEQVLGSIEPGRGMRCLRCHSTLLVHDGTKLMRNESRFGVTCERCHGPGRAHVQAAWRGQHVPIGDRPFERAMQAARSATEFREAASRRDSVVCGECHGNDALSPNVPDFYLSRFPIAALPQSKCYRQSLGKLLCTDCHDPHSNAEHDDMSRYVRVCLVCHGTKNADMKTGSAHLVPPPVRNSCTVNPDDGCIGCHMPKREPVYRGIFTHHRIAIHTSDESNDP
jgi:hypothetical protein